MSRSRTKILKKSAVYRRSLWFESEQKQEHNREKVSKTSGTYVSPLLSIGLNLSNLLLEFA
jgi:hypothetical protein